MLGGSKRTAVPGASSLRGRYVYAAIFLSLLLFGVAILGQISVREQGQTHRQQLWLRHTAADAVQTLTFRLHELNSAAWEFILLPEKTQHQILSDLYNTFDSEISSILATEQLDEMPELRTALTDLKSNSTRLGVQLKKLMTVRLDAEKTFPVTSYMLAINPDNLEFYSSVALALEEIEEEPEASRDWEVYRVFSRLRFAWSQYVEEFRLMVAIRFGIFAGDLHKAIQQRKGNLRLYAVTIDRSLKRLGELEQQGRVSNFQGMVSLARMRDIRKTAGDNFEKAIGVLESQHWRKDLDLFEEQIIPVFFAARGDLHKAKAALDKSSTTSMEDLGHTTARLSDTLWLLAIGGLLVIAVGYLIVDRALLRPIAQLTHALQEEARGGEPALTLKTSAKETAGLVEAFDEMRHQVHIRQQRLENILDNAAEAIITIDEQGSIESFNNAAERLFGYRDHEVLGRNVSELIPAPRQSLHQGYLAYLLKTSETNVTGSDREVEAQRKDGTRIPVSLKVSETVVGGRRLYTGLLEDISERKAMLERLQQMAEQDPLTGLPNRILFRDRLKHAIAQACRNENVLALMFLDLDNFKDINDSMGHQAGDELLKAVAGRLRETIRLSDTLSRLGGDEFTIILEGLAHADQAVTAAQKILNVFNEPFTLAGREFHVGTSIGIAIYPLDGKEPDALIKNADTAMYHAKKSGGGRYRFYSQEMSEWIEARQALQTELRRALEREEFVLHYQPIVYLEPGQANGVEALLRWQHPQRGLVPPNDFIPALEETGLIIPTTQWVLAQVGACYQMLKAAGFSEATVSVNFTPQCFGVPNMVHCVQGMLEANNIPPQNLIIEITENVLIQASEHLASVIQQLKELGIRFALDDFGTGYSSLSHLKRFPIDIVKIDRSFVQGVETEPTDAALASAIISMSHRLGLKVVAEGVETRGQLEFLQEQGCDAIQGYLISKAVPANELLSVLSNSTLDAGIGRRGIV